MSVADLTREAAVSLYFGAYIVTILSALALLVYVWTKRGGR